MIEQQGRVVRVEDHHAWVRVGSRSGCSACDAGKGCGAGLFAKLVKRDTADVRVENHINAHAGAAVILGIPESLYLGLVMRLYGLPLLAGLAGAMTGHQLMAGAGAGWQDFATLAGALTAAGLVFRFAQGRLADQVAGSGPRLIAQAKANENCGLPGSNGR